MKHISIIINDTKPKAYVILSKFMKIIEPYDFDILINKANEDTEMIFTIGGDGTMVRSLKEHKNIPTIGINGGTLGFLTEIGENNLEECFKQVMDKNYTLSYCNTLQCTIVRGEVVVYHNISINDIVLSRSSALEMVRFYVYINDKKIKEYNADGFIVSTPLGASAYSLSCGGPLIEPTSHLIELTPIAPHSLINRSIVVDDTKEVMLEIVDSRNNKRNTLLSIDGEDPIELMVKDKVYIKKNDEQVKLVRLNNESFVDNLAKKMYLT